MARVEDRTVRSRRAEAEPAAAHGGEEWRGDSNARSPEERYPSPEEIPAQGARARQILEASLVVMTDRGAGKLRLIDVAREAGVSVGMIQHYFETRDRLLEETFREANRRALAATSDIAAREPDPRRRLQLTIRHALEAPRWPIWLDYWTAAYRNAKIRSQCEVQYRLWTAPFLAAVLEGIASGQFAPSTPARDIADRITTMVDGFAIRLLRRDATMNIDRAVELATQRLDEELGVTDRKRNRKRAQRA